MAEEERERGDMIDSGAPAALIERNRVHTPVLFQPQRTPIRATAKIRYRAKDAPVTITPDQTGLGATLTFDEPQRAITPGQAAVFYDGEVCLGGGWIEPSLPASAPAH